MFENKDRFLCKKTNLMDKILLIYGKIRIRDDGLAIFKNVSGTKAEKIKKDIQKIFKDYQLNIIIQCTLKIVSYLDVTFNLSNATYRPFCKTSNEITYIHKESNHPPSILRQIPLSIESRISRHSSNEKIFKESAQI